MALRVFINYDRCCWNSEKCNSGCVYRKGNRCLRGGCAENCPTGAITRGEKVVVDMSKCNLCGKCVKSCDNMAISII